VPAAAAAARTVRPRRPEQYAWGTQAAGADNLQSGAASLVFVVPRSLCVIAVWASQCAARALLPCTRRGAPCRGLATANVGYTLSMLSPDARAGAGRGRRGPAAGGAGGGAGARPRAPGRAARARARCRGRHAHQPRLPAPQPAVRPASWGCCGSGVGERLLGSQTRERLAVRDTQCALSSCLVLCQDGCASMHCTCP
jgi:hypothetical protein